MTNNLNTVDEDARIRIEQLEKRVEYLEDKYQELLKAIKNVNINKGYTI